LLIIFNIFDELAKFLFVLVLFHSDIVFWWQGLLKNCTFFSRYRGIPYLDKVESNSIFHAIPLVFVRVMSDLGYNHFIGVNTNKKYMRKHVMKKTAVVLGSTLALFASIASAEVVQHAETTVFVNIDSTLAVMAEDSRDLGTTMTGAFGKEVVFKVQSNNEQLWMSAAATHLYKGMDPNSEVAPLMVIKSAGVTITPSAGTRLLSEGGSNTLALDDDTYEHSSGMKGVMSEVGGFESSENGTWDQYVDVDFQWDVPSTQTEGEYGGYVSLWVYIDGAASAPAPATVDVDVPA